MLLSFELADCSGAAVQFVMQNFTSTAKALLSPRGAYLISCLPEGGLIERGLIR